MSHQLSPAELEDAAFKPLVREAADKLLELINRHVAAQVAIASVKREPLSVPALREIEQRHVYARSATLIDFARAIEQAHGIGVVKDSLTTAGRGDGDA